jgi:acetyl esterase/lipase
MKSLFVLACALLVPGGVSAQTRGWEPSAGHTQMPIRPGAAPDLQPAAGPEHAGMATEPIAGKLGQFVENVSRPTMTVYSPTGENTGAAVVVFPGGGYQELAIDLEGTEVCDWLTPKGITCVLLKYRVPNTGEHWDEKCNCELKPKAPMALEDAQRTVRLVRLHAAEWHIDPHRIGVLGFSAGGHLSAAISTHFKQRLYRPWTRLTRNAAGRILRWLSIRSIYGLTRGDSRVESGCSSHPGDATKRSCYRPRTTTWTT